MNINKLIDRISNNWAAKVICLILAFFLYIYNRTTSLQKKTYTVPLTVEAEGLVMPAANLPKFVKVLVTTTKENMAFIQESDFHAKVDLDNFTDPGEYTVPVTVSVSEKLELLDTFECRVKTETVNVLLDERILKYIPVEVAASGTPAYGYKISQFDVSPATVKVVGPSRIVEKTKRIYTRKVIVDGAATSFSLDTKLDTGFNSKIKILPESDFKITVKIEPQEETRKYEKIIPEILNLDQKFEILTELPKIDISATGTVLALDAFSPKPGVVSANLKDISEAGEYEIPLEFNLPAGIKLESKSAETMILQISEKSTENSASETELNSESEKTDDSKNEGNSVSEEKTEKKAE